MKYLERAKLILWQMSEMYGDETFISEGYAYYEDCAKAMAEEMAKVESETLARVINDMG